MLIYDEGFLLAAQFAPTTVSMLQHRGDISRPSFHGVKKEQVTTRGAPFVLYTFEPIWS